MLLAITLASTLLFSRQQKNQEQLADSLFAKGVEFIATNQADSAIYYFNELLELDSSDVYARMNKAIAFEIKGETDSAFAEAQIAIEMDSSFAEMFLLLGICQFKKVEFKKAEQAFQKAIELNDTLIAAYENLALCQVKQDNFYEAINFATRAQFHGADIDKIQQYVFYSAGIHELENKNYLEALSRFDNILTMHENDAAFLHLLGLCFYQLKDYDHAIDNFSKVLKIEPENQEFLFHRAHAYYASQQYEKAMKDYDKVDDASANYKMAKRNLFFQKNSMYFMMGIVLILFAACFRIFRKRIQ